MRLGPFRVIRVRWARHALWGHTATHCLDLPLVESQTFTLTVNVAGVERVFTNAREARCNCEPWRPSQRLAAEAADRNAAHERAREVAKTVGTRRAS